MSCVVLERGDSVRDRDRSRASDLVVGVGGAGLYSDGKFSFAPSATKLWELEPRVALNEAYNWTATTLLEHGVNAPPLPAWGASKGEDGLIKAYPSQYMGLDERLALIDSLERQVGDALVTGADVCLRARPEGVAGDLQDRRFLGRTGIVASGRFGPLRAVEGLPSEFRRVEIGMRVEQRADRFVLNAESVAALLDPKWVRRSPDGRREWRTFCCCRRGEVVETCFDDITTVSGRADGPPTDRSNFGLNVRFLEVAEAEDALARVMEAARRPALRVQAGDLLEGGTASRTVDAFGANVADALAEGLTALGDDLGVDVWDATLHLPAIEGVGYYPPVSGSLRVRSAIWVAGDVTGVFRGLVPALVSGRLAAMEAIDVLRRH